MEEGCNARTANEMEARLQALEQQISAQVEKAKNLEAENERIRRQAEQEVRAAQREADMWRDRAARTPEEETPSPGFVPPPTNGAGTSTSAPVPPNANGNASSHGLGTPPEQPHIPPPRYGPGEEIRYLGTPFARWIAEAELPHGFRMPDFKHYDGSSDPDEHLNHMKQKMISAYIPAGYYEVCLCKGFGTSLAGNALAWFAALPPGHITSYQGLVRVFTAHFAINKAIRRQSSDLYAITMRKGDTQKAYIQKFNSELLGIPNCNPETAVDAFKKGLQTHLPLYRKLVRKPCRTMEEVMEIAIPCVREEEDEISRGVRKTMEYRNDVRERGRAPQREFRPRIIHRPVEVYDLEKPRGGTRRFSLTREEEDVNRCITANTTKLMREMKRIEEMRKPEKIRSAPETRNKDLWCDFHQDHGHTTLRCKIMIKEAVRLMRKGYLLDCLSEEGRRLVSPNRGQRDDRVGRRLPAIREQGEMEVAVILGGSDRSGPSRAAAKRSLRQAKAGSSEINNIAFAAPIKYQISFADEEEALGLGMHDDALVITVSIANYRVRRMLVDNGSSANVILIDALKIMNIPVEHIQPHDKPIIGFGGQSHYPIGQITLPTKVEGEQVMVTYIVVPSLNTYNGILGRPWLHDLRAIASTLHQMVKFPAKDGIKCIRGDQRVSRECYAAGEML